MSGFNIIQHLNAPCPKFLATVPSDATVTIPCETIIPESEPSPKIEIVLRNLPQPVQQQEFRPKKPKQIPPKVLRK